mgnify:CR=1 FL=1
MDASTSRPAAYRVARAVAWFLASLLIFGLTCELIVRNMRPNPKFQIVRDTYTRHRLYEVEGIPIWKDADTEPRWNTACVAANPEARPLLVYGSSILYGAGLKAEEAFTSALQRHFGTTRCVMNFAQQGSSMQTKYARALETLPKYPGSDILMEIWHGDRSEYVMLGNSAFGLRDIRVDKAGYPDPFRVPAPLNGLLFRSSRTYEYAALAMSTPAFKDRMEDHVLPRLDAILEMAVKYDSTLSLVFAVPLQENPMPLAAETPGYAAIIAWADAHAVPWSGLGELLADQDVLDIRMDPCCHFNAHGQSIIAERVVPFLRDATATP